jgi:hypothetical protein
MTRAGTRKARAGAAMFRSLPGMVFVISLII